VHVLPSEPFAKVFRLARITGARIKNDLTGTKVSLSAFDNL
jgi:hypothetical protein